MKTREVACENYACEGSCKVGMKAEFYGHCQKCESYKAKKGGRPARKDNRGDKMRKIVSKEAKEFGY